uniref:Uncharacterized protein n=1 Tax=Ditylenchus dipsaci TaxID=166011 RepID=A0A915DZR8_9BILA
MASALFQAFCLILLSYLIGNLHGTNSILRDIVQIYKININLEYKAAVDHQNVMLIYEDMEKKDPNFKNYVFHRVRNGEIKEKIDKSSKIEKGDNIAFKIKAKEDLSIDYTAYPNNITGVNDKNRKYHENPGLVQIYKINVELEYKDTFETKDADNKKITLTLRYMNKKYALKDKNLVFYRVKDSKLDRETINNLPKLEEGDDVAFIISYNNARAGEYQENPKFYGAANPNYQQNSWYYEHPGNFDHTANHFHHDNYATGGEHQQNPDFYSGVNYRESGYYAHPGINQNSGYYAHPSYSQQNTSQFHHAQPAPSEHHYSQHYYDDYDKNHQQYYKPVDQTTDADMQAARDTAKYLWNFMGYEN